MTGRHSNNGTKARKDFPLTPHPRGYWYKKVAGKTHDFCKIADDPAGLAAAKLWLAHVDIIHAGENTAE